MDTDDTRLITARQGCELFGCGLTSWYNLVKNDPSFPKPIKFSPGMVRWRLNELGAYIGQKGETSRGAA
jgi:predicted DNA-binding transcriptional regulator AlpA